MLYVRQGLLSLLCPCIYVKSYIYIYIYIEYCMSRCTRKYVVISRFNVQNCDMCMYVYVYVVYVYMCTCM